MGDILFVIKCLVVTVVLVVVMQIKIDRQTIEQRSVRWLRHSPVVEQLQLVAEGALRAGREGTKLVSNLFGEGSSYSQKTISASKDEWFPVKRSDAYYKQKAREKAAAAETAVEEIADEVVEEAGY